MAETGPRPEPDAGAERAPRRERRSRKRREKSPDAGPRPPATPEISPEEQARADAEIADALARAEVLASTAETRTVPRGAVGIDVPAGGKLWETTKDIGGWTKDVWVETNVQNAKFMMGSAAVFGYLGYKTAGFAAKTGLILVDFLARRVDKLADKMINKNIPFLKYIVNPLASIADWGAKKLGVDKSLYEHLKKNAEDRKKVAQKLLEDFRKSEAAFEKKSDDKAAKKKAQDERDAKRLEALTKKVGARNADLLAKEMRDIDDEAEENVPATEAPPAPEPATPKAA